jgi:glycosyltransferase involved in cell wall biosynthesis
MSKRLVYIGNNLISENPTTIKKLVLILEELGWKVDMYSNKKNKVFRLIEMCFGILKNRRAYIVLIDTYSTLNFYYAIIISQLARIIGLDYIPILHGGNLPMRLNNNSYLSNLLFKNAKINISPSNYLYTVFKNKGFKVQVIPNAINIEDYPLKERSSLKPRLLWVRAFNKIYNPQMAIKVLALLKREFPSAILCMVGPDNDGSLVDVRNLAKELDIEESVEFTGKLTKQEWIKKSKSYDIFIYTTTIDNTPVSVIEAMALGLPIVSTKVGGIPYLIEHEKSGILVNNNDSEAMASEISRLIKSDSSVLIKNAREIAEGFDDSKVKAQWFKVLGT